MTACPLVECSDAVTSTIQWTRMVRSCRRPSSIRVPVLQIYHFSLSVCPVAPLCTCLISPYRFEHEDHAVHHVYGDQSICEGLRILWENRSSSIAVLNRENKRLIGSLSKSVVHLLLDNDDLFCSRK